MIASPIGQLQINLERAPSLTQPVSHHCFGPWYGRQEENLETRKERKRTRRERREGSEGRKGKVVGTQESGLEVLHLTSPGPHPPAQPHRKSREFVKARRLIP